MTIAQAIAHHLVFAGPWRDLSIWTDPLGMLFWAQHVAGSWFITPYGFPF